MNNKMRKIKLSDKLFIGLTIIVLALLVWQAYFTKSEIQRKESLSNVTSAEEFMNLIKDNSDYKQIPLSEDIKTINFKDNISAIIMKGERNAILIHKYSRYKPNKTLLSGNDIILKHEKETNENIMSMEGIIIILKTEPEKISLTKDYPIHILLAGFNGENTQIENYANRLYLSTDMEKIDIINHWEGRIEIDTKVFNNSEIKTSERKINIHGEVSRFKLNDISDTLSLNMELDYGHFIIDLAESTHLKQLNIQGSLYQNIEFGDYYKSFINAPSLSVGDSIYFNLVCPEEERKHILHLPKELREKQESLPLCEGIEIVPSEI